MSSVVCVRGCSRVSYAPTLRLAAEPTATVELMDAVEVRRSPRARRWRLEVPWREPARLTVPRWMSRAEIEHLLVQEQPWLEEQRRRQVQRRRTGAISVGTRSTALVVRLTARPSRIATPRIEPRREKP